MLCRLFTERADGFCHCVVPSKQQPQGTLQGAEPAAASGYAIFSTHWPHFNVRWRQKRWREGCWLAAFSDKDEGFVLWQSAPLRPWRHCSASSQPHNVTAKSVKPQQRQLLFFDTVEVKLVKKKKKKSETWKTNKPLPNSTLRSPLLYFSYFLTQKSHNGTSSIFPSPS